MCQHVLLVMQVKVRVKINGRYGNLNVDLTCSFCRDFEFSCLVLQFDWSGEGLAPPHQAPPHPRHKIT